ncbi:hypothetical protein ACFPRL_07250 [Pseudoclavibacter helvolus]
MVPSERRRADESPASSPGKRLEVLQAPWRGPRGGVGEERVLGRVGRWRRALGLEQLDDDGGTRPLGQPSEERDRFLVGALREGKRRGNDVRVSSAEALGGLELAAGL